MLSPEWCCSEKRVVPQKKPGQLALGESLTLSEPSA